MTLRAQTVTALFAAAATFAINATGQNGSFLFTTHLTETSLSTCPGPLMRQLRPNEIHQFHCEIVFGVAEKFCPRTAFHVMAGDADGDGVYWDDDIFGKIDALQVTIEPGGPDINSRSIYFSPSVALGTCVSGGLGLRPGDVGAIVRNSTPEDGKIEYFITQEQLSTSMGLGPTTLNIDAIAASQTIGIAFSLEETITGISSFCGSPTVALDGAVLFIPAAAIVWNDFKVDSVALGSAFVLHTEAEMDAFVANSGVGDRDGLCPSAIVDTDALEIDYENGSGGVAAGTVCGVVVPQLIFAGETLTGAGVLDTGNGGQIHTSGCGQLAASCPSPSLGDRVGMQQTSGVQGVPSSLNSFSFGWPHRFILESPTPVVLTNAPIEIQAYGPGVGPFVWLAVSLAPSGACAVPASLDFTATYSLPTNCFPDIYGPPLNILFIPASCGFASINSFAPNFAAKILIQGVSFSGTDFELSTPMMIDVQ